MTYIKCKKPWLSQTQKESYLSNEHFFYLDILVKTTCHRLKGHMNVTIMTLDLQYKWKPLYNPSSSWYGLHGYDRNKGLHRMSSFLDMATISENHTNHLCLCRASGLCSFRQNLPSHVLKLFGNLHNIHTILEVKWHVRTTRHIVHMLSHHLWTKLIGLSKLRWPRFMSHSRHGIGEDYGGLHRNITLLSEKSNTITQLSVYCAWFTEHNYQE